MEIVLNINGLTEGNVKDVSEFLNCIKELKVKVTIYVDSNPKIMDYSKPKK